MLISKLQKTAETFFSEFFIVENGGAGEFWAAPSEGAASAFRFDQSERDTPGAFFAFGLGPKSQNNIIYLFYSHCFSSSCEANYFSID